MRKINKTDFKIVITENNQNQDLETCISMKFDTECNETTPTIASDRFHEDSKIFAKKNEVKSLSYVIRNLEVRKESRTYMELAIFKTLETTVTFSVSILYMSENQ